MPGINEIVLVAVIALSLFFFARRSHKRPVMQPVFSFKEKIGGWKRLGIAASIFWPIFMGIFLEPWSNNPLHFIYFGILPVAAVWGIAWVIDGYKKEKY
jgi:hypothetical protein